MAQSFTCAANGRLRELPFKCGIAPAFASKTTPADKRPAFKEFRAIFDTGATNCVIKQEVVDALGLKQVGVAISETANGKCDCEVYLVNIALPNHVGFEGWRVTKQDLPKNTDVLIGMDVIGAGDFAVTHKDGKTMFSFRIPSTVEIDFVEHDKATPAPVKLEPIVARNSRCPCNSGKKFKHCCGAGVH